MFMFRKTEMPAPREALAGRSTPLPTAEKHFVNGRSLKGPYPAGARKAMFGMGCFWGAATARADFACAAHLLIGIAVADEGLHQGTRIGRA
jgi:hypothetical protein